MNVTTAARTSVGSTGLVAVAARFGVAGVVNTGAGLSTIAVLDFILGIDPWIANLTGYAVGLLVAFTLNRRFVFARSQGRPGTVHRFLMAFAVAFTANQAMLAGMSAVHSNGGWADPLAQAAGMTTYTIVMFALCRAWVYGRQARRTGSPRPKSSPHGDRRPEARSGHLPRS